jgi:plastocyanin
MSLVAAGYVVMMAAIAFGVFVIFLPLAGQPGAPPIPIFVVFIVIFAILAVAAYAWSGARRRAWFWLVAVLPCVAILLMNAPFIPHDIVRPANTREFLLTIFVLAGGVAVVAGGVAAFREVRRGQSVWAKTGRPGLVSIGVAGALLGAAMTGVAAGAVPGGGAAVAETPTVTGVITAEETTFVETSLQMDVGATLGLFLVNKDGIGHTFDIDSLNIHVELPANSAAAVAIKPTGPGPVEFYCAVPGHREAGMVGTIDVGA